MTGISQIVPDTLLNQLIRLEFLSWELDRYQEWVVNKSTLFQVGDILLQYFNKMLIDLCKAKLFGFLCLQIYPVQVLPIRLIGHQSFRSPPLRASFQVKFVPQHLWLFQLDCVFHQAHHDRGHTSAFNSENAENLGYQGVRVW